jgi:CheY-like chemotaxis protein
MRTMSGDGRRKVERGLTVLSEVARVVPADEPEEAGPGAVPVLLSDEVSAPQPPRILVVDDDAALLEVLEETLRGESYDVMSARNGEEALALVYRDRPDLVLTDVQMPVMGGLELLKRLRRDLSTCQIPVVFLTVLENGDSEAQALDLGADDYVAKSAPRAKLLSRVRRAIYRGQLMRSGH